MRELAVKVCALHAVSPRTCGRASCRDRFLYVNVNDSDDHSRLIRIFMIEQMHAIFHGGTSVAICIFAPAHAEQAADRRR
jgi:hypothetical protein